MTTGTVTAQAKRRFFYGYTIVIAAFLVMVLTAGPFYSFGVFVKPLIDEFGWSRAGTAGVYSVTMLMAGIFSIITGKLNDRVGPRRLLTVCGISLGAGYMLTSGISEVWQFYLLYGVLVAIGQSGSLIPMMSTVARWFIKRRVLMSGIAVAGVGVGQIITPPIVARLVEVYGWRLSYLFMGGGVMVLLVVLARFLRRDPEQMGLLPDGALQVKAETLAADSCGSSRQEALRSRQFWIIFALYICYGYMVQGTMVHLVPYATDLGISAVAAASILSLVGAITVVGRIGMSSIGDRIGHKRELYTVFSLAIGGYILLQFATELWMLYLFATLFGFSYGALIALESPLVAELFGMKAHGVLLGLVHLGTTIGGMVSPLLAGLIFDATGSYNGSSSRKPRTVDTI